MRHEAKWRLLHQQMDVATCLVFMLEQPSWQFWAHQPFWRLSDIAQGQNAASSLSCCSHHMYQGDTLAAARCRGHFKQHWRYSADNLNLQHDAHLQTDQLPGMLKHQYCPRACRPAQKQASSADGAGPLLDFEAQAARLAAAVAEETDAPRSSPLAGSIEGADDTAEPGRGAAPGSEAGPESLASPAPAEGARAKDPRPAALGRRRRARLDSDLLRAVQAAGAPDAGGANDAAALRGSLGAVLGISGAGGTYGLQVPPADAERQGWSVALPATRGVVTAPDSGATSDASGGRMTGFSAGAFPSEGLAARVAELEAALGMLAASGAQADAQLRAAAAEVHLVPVHCYAGAAHAELGMSCMQTHGILCVHVGVGTVYSSALLRAHAGDRARGAGGGAAGGGVRARGCAAGAAGGGAGAHRRAGAGGAHAASAACAHWGVLPGI